MIKDYQDYKSQFDEFKTDFNLTSKRVDEFEEVEKFLRMNGIDFDEVKFAAAQKVWSKKLSALYKERDQLVSELKELQEHCEHEWDHTGQDHLHHFYRCRKCGLEYME